MPQDENNKKKGFNLNSSEQHDTLIGDSWFFGIGINHYDEFPHLNNAVKDVNDICSLLQNDYDISEEKTVLLFDSEATRKNIIAKLDWIKKQIKTNDKFILYYSGHGHLDDDQKGYWIPTDAHKDHTANYIRNSTIRDYIEDIDAIHTLLISDSCFSGSLLVRGANRSITAIDQLEQRISRWAICSGRHDEEVYDGPPGKNSPFCESILDTLKFNQDEKFNVAKLADQVVEITSANYKQLPEGAPMYGVGHKGGQYIFKRKMVEPDPEPEPEPKKEQKQEPEPVPEPESKIEAIEKELDEAPRVSEEEERLKEEKEAVLKAIHEKAAKLQTQNEKIEKPEVPKVDPKPKEIKEKKKIEPDEVPMAFGQTSEPSLVKETKPPEFTFLQNYILGRKGTYLILAFSTFGFSVACLAFVFPSISGTGNNALFIIYLFFLSFISIIGIRHGYKAIASKESNWVLKTLAIGLNLLVLLFCLIFLIVISIFSKGF